MKKYYSLLLMILVIGSCSQKEQKITELQSLKDKRICVLTGSAGDVITRERFPEADIIDIATATDAAFNVKMGKADAFIFDYEVLNNITKKYPDLSLLEKSVGQVDIAVALEKSRTGLLDSVNMALAQLDNEGVLASMKDKWIDSQYDEVPALPSINLGNMEETITVGICAEAEPMMFVANNIFTGYDMELSLRIGEILGRNVEFVNMTFDTLILALHSEKIDYAISAFNVTKERKEYVNFSQPYMVQDISALVRK